MQPGIVIALFSGLMVCLALLVIWEFRHSKKDSSWQMAEPAAIGKVRYEPPAGSQVRGTSFNRVD